MTKKFPIYTIIAFLILSTGCDKDQVLVVKELAQINIESLNGDRLDLIENPTTNLMATGIDQLGDPIEIEGLVWSSDNGNVIIDANGLVTSVQVGESVITASAQNIEAEFALTIKDISTQDYHIYVSDRRSASLPPHQVLHFDQNGEFVKVFANNESIDGPRDIIFLEEQNIALISNFGSKKISRYDARTGAYIDDFALIDGGPTTIRIGPDGLVYVLQLEGSGFVLRYEQDGTFVDEFSEIGVAGSASMDWDSEGNLYVGSNSGYVRKFDQNGKDLDFFVPAFTFFLSDIWFMDGHLFAADNVGNQVVEFDEDGNFVKNLMIIPNPQGVAILPDGNFLIGSGGDSNVKIYTREGAFVKDFVPSNFADLQEPNAIYIRHLE